MPKDGPKILPCLAIILVALPCLLTTPARAQSPPAEPSREERLEGRLRRLETRYSEMDRQHEARYEAILTELRASRDQAKPSPSPPAVAQPRGSAASLAAPGALQDAPPDYVLPTGPRLAAPGVSARPGFLNLTADVGVPSSRELGGVGAQGTAGRTFVREYENKPLKRAGKLTFAEGLEFGSIDDQFKLTFHNLSQVDYRAFPTRDHGLLQDQFLIPRQRWYFTGQVTRNFEFYTVINRGYGSLDLLDSFITLNVSEILTNPESGSDPVLPGGEAGGAQGGYGRAQSEQGTDSRVRLRVGRMKTPYLYEYFSIAEGDLIAPERSLYAGNLSTNRQVGAMFLGQLFKNRLDYAAGVFDGNRRSFNDTNSNLDLFGYVNSRPFLESDALPALKYLAFGGSINGGGGSGPVQPAIFTTANDQSASSSNSVVQSVSPTFLAFNNNVVQRGSREQWAGNVVYFYKSLMLLGEYGGGYQGYANDRFSSVRVPFDGYMVQAAYFLTGEELTRRVNVVRPIHKLGYKDGKFGIGAVEVHGRFSELDLSPRVFTSGLADPNRWANRAEAVDVGINWYFNYYTKVQLDWQHAMYNQAITTGAPNHSVHATDLFWLRFQLFF